jgi:hypothetical protein
LVLVELAEHKFLEDLVEHHGQVRLQVDKLVRWDKVEMVDFGKLLLAAAAAADITAAAAAEMMAAALVQMAAAAAAAVLL